MIAEKWKPHLALLVVNAIYGAGYSIAKIPLNGFINPGVFIFIRVSVSLFLFAILVFLLIKSKYKIDLSDIPRLALCGLFGISINQICFFEGLSRTSEMNASLLMILSPILVLIIATISGEEKNSFIKILGVCLGVIGALIILFNKGLNLSLNKVGLIGDMYILINAISYSIYLVIVKKLMTKYEVLKVIMYVFLFGWFPVLFYSIPKFKDVDFTSFTSSVWLSIAFIVLFVTFIAYLLNIYAIGKSSASLVGVYIYIQPIFAAFFTFIFTHKALYFYHILASVFIFTGVYLVSFSHRFSSMIKRPIS
jgi:drug/metabolite transporter (DMT)-like permease